MSDPICRKCQTPLYVGLGTQPPVCQSPACSAYVPPMLERQRKQAPRANDRALAKATSAGATYSTSRPDKILRDTLKHGRDLRRQHAVRERLVQEARDARERAHNIFIYPVEMFVSLSRTDRFRALATLPPGVFEAYGRLHDHLGSERRSRSRSSAVLPPGARRRTATACALCEGPLAPEDYADAADLNLDPVCELCRYHLRDVQDGVYE